MRTPTCLILAAILSAGCESDHYGSKDDPHDASIKVPSIDKTYELVGNGHPPLSLIVTTGGWVKIVDMTAGEIIHTAQLPAVNGGLVVQLDAEKKAVTYRNTSEKSELPEIILPIDPTHKYELYYQR